MKAVRIFVITLVATLLAGVIITYPYWKEKLPQKEQDAVATEVSEAAPTPEGPVTVKIEAIPTPTEPPFEEFDIRIMAVGDNLMHLGIVNAGKQEDGTLNYDCLFENIKPYLDKADISIINQETIMAGNEKGFSGYPYFNTPVEVADAIENAGFNVVLQSSNHTIDQGIDGLSYAYDVWQQHPGVMMIGIHKELEAERTIPIKEVNGVKVAVLNYTYGPNLGAVPGDVAGHMDILCAVKPGSSYNELDFTTINPDVLDDIRKADELADIVVVCPHWGTEYATEPSSYQVKFAKQMTEAGADVIIGAHPHVPEPVEWVTADNGNKCLCYYSLGNYVSTGQEGKSMLEGMAWAVIHVSEDSVYIDENKSGVLPMVMQYRSGPLRFENVYALEDYTDELASKHGIRGWGGVELTVDKLNTWSREIFGEWSLSKEYILNQ